MNQDQPSTGARKRQQIDTTNKQMMIYVAAAAAIVTICAMLAVNFYQRVSYQMKVNSEWGTTNDNLKNSISNIPKLRENVEALSANSSIKSIQGLVDPELEKWQIVFDVLPSSCDTLAVEYAFTNIIFKPSQLSGGIEKATAILEGASCDAEILAVAGEEVASSDTSGLIKPQAILMTVSFELHGVSDEDIRKTLLSMEYSLHPINVQSIEVTRDILDGGGYGDSLSAEITVVTYFVPKANWLPGEKLIPVDENATASSEEEATE